MTVLRGGLVETPLKHAGKTCLLYHERSTGEDHRRTIETCDCKLESNGITSQLSFFALIVEYNATTPLGNGQRLARPASKEPYCLREATFARERERERGSAKRVGEGH